MEERNRFEYTWDCLRGFSNSSLTQLKATLSLFISSHSPLGYKSQKPRNHLYIFPSNPTTNHSPNLIFLKPNVWPISRFHYLHISHNFYTRCHNPHRFPTSTTAPANLFSKLQAASSFKNHKCDDISVT